MASERWDGQTDGQTDGRQTVSTTLLRVLRKHCQSTVENLWPTVLKFVKIREFYHFIFLKIRSISERAGELIIMNAVMNFDIESFKFAFCV